MKKLSANLFKQLKDYMDSDARPLERSIFNYYFNDSSSEGILNSLEAFQNQDGGFGQGIEPDFKLTMSSPMATSIGLRHLSKIDYSVRAQNMIAKAVSYLETTFDSKRNGWFSVSSNVNGFPHAPWWEFKSDINMTVIDYSWGNPTAELIGYLYKYKKYLNIIDIYSLVNYAMTNLNNCIDFKSEHEIYCYIKMYDVMDKEFSSQIEDSLILAVSQLVNLNKSEWINYVPIPLKFIESDTKNYLGIEGKYIEQNLDYLIDKLEEDGKISPSCKWDKYLEEWEIAKIEWMGILTLEALLSLLNFKRI